MSGYGKGNFGSGIEISAQVVNGKCPFCNADGIFVSIHRNFYRCMNCGGDTEQKVNGVISYIPASMSGKTPNLTQSSNTPEGNG